MEKCAVQMNFVVIEENRENIFKSVCKWRLTMLRNQNWKCLFRLWSLNHTYDHWANDHTHRFISLIAIITSIVIIHKLIVKIFFSCVRLILNGYSDFRQFIHPNDNDDIWPIVNSKLQRIFDYYANEILHPILCIVYNYLFSPLESVWT